MRRNLIATGTIVVASTFSAQVERKGAFEERSESVLFQVVVSRDNDWARKGRALLMTLVHGHSRYDDVYFGR